MALWFGRKRALVALPDPDPGVPLTPQRTAAEHALLGGGRVVDFMGGPVRDFTLRWSGLTAAEVGLIEAFYDGSNGPGPWSLVPVDAERWNFLPPAVAAASSMTGDTVGWSYDSGTTLESVDDPILRGPRALQWSVPAAGGERWLYHSDSLPLGEGPVTFTFNARAINGTPTVFAQIYGDLSSTDGPDTLIGADWTEVTATHPATADDAYYLFVGMEPGADATIVIDTPRLTATPAPAPWSPGRGVPAVAITALSIVARWADSYDVSATLREVTPA